MGALIAGNWKMNGLTADLAELDAIADSLAAEPAAAEALVCPPATLLAAAAKRLKGRAGVGGQTCHPNEKGAHTGELSADMLKDAGAAYVIVGHSERRADCGEGDADVKARAEAALRAGLRPIVAIGETLEEREAGRVVERLLEQLAGSLPDAAAIDVAYEPVWAIGTGRTPSLADIGEAHAAIRTALAERFGSAAADIRVLYGGSVKPGNAAEILAVDGVGGALVGGASLKAADFLAIVRAA
ncbi:MAG: triose-phosphate isomerase [Pseudomonadota bacterium]